MNSTAIGVTIPEQAEEVAREEFIEHGLYRALEAAAPLIIAAELERQADEFDHIHYNRVADLLRERADSLKGSG